MSGLVNFIKSLFSGIFGFIGGLFGGKKDQAAVGSEAGSQANRKKSKDGFFLELEEAKDAVLAKADTAKDAVVAKAESVASSVSEAVATVTDSDKADPKPGKKSSRKEKLAALAKDSPKPAASAPTPAPVAKAAKAGEPEVAFASKYLLTSGSNGRRRPGANMAPYLNMARQVKAG